MDRHRAITSDRAHERHHGWRMTVAARTAAIQAQHLRQNELAPCRRDLETAPPAQIDSLDLSAERRLGCVPDRQRLAAKLLLLLRLLGRACARAPLALLAAPR